MTVLTNAATQSAAFPVTKWHKDTYLLKPLLPQTDHIKVKIRPEAVGPVESDSPSQAVPVGLKTDRLCEHAHTRSSLFYTHGSSFLSHTQMLHLYQRGSNYPSVQIWRRVMGELAAAERLLLS